MASEEIENLQELDEEKLSSISVIVPESPFDKGVKRYICALDVDKLMYWWPGKVHDVNRDVKKVKYIQRSLDWKRVADIAAFLLQEEITDAVDELTECFKDIYGTTDVEPGREWPPKVGKVITPKKSVCPDFGNILIHVNGAKLDPVTKGEKTTLLHLKKKDNPDFELTVIDGQHRINGAYFALYLLRQEKPEATMDVPATVYLNLDDKGAPPKKQAQIFIDVNFYQKKVDRSLAVDLFPTARIGEKGKDSTDRAHDISRKLMLEEGPLVGMIQIPGIRYGVKGVITLSTLSSAVESILAEISKLGYQTITEQTWIISLALDAWFQATGRKQEFTNEQNFEIEEESAVYQGRLIVSIIYLLPGLIAKYKDNLVKSDDSEIVKTFKTGLKKLLKRANLLKDEKFINKSDFKKHGFLGSGGIGRLRDLLWASLDEKFDRGRQNDGAIKEAAEEAKKTYYLSE